MIMSAGNQNPDQLSYSTPFGCYCPLVVAGAINDVSEGVVHLRWCWQRVRDSDWHCAYEPTSSVFPSASMRLSTISIDLSSTHFVVGGATCYCRRKYQYEQYKALGKSSITCCYFTPITITNAFYWTLWIRTRLLTGGWSSTVHGKMQWTT